MAAQRELPRQLQPFLASTSHREARRRPGSQVHLWAASACTPSSSQAMRSRSSLYRPLAANYDAWVVPLREHGASASRTATGRSTPSAATAAHCSTPSCTARQPRWLRSLGRGDFEDPRYQRDAASGDRHSSLQSSDLDFVTRAVPRPNRAAPTMDRAAAGGAPAQSWRCPPQWPIGDLVTSRELQASTPWYFKRYLGGRLALRRLVARLTGAVASAPRGVTHR